MPANYALWILVLCCILTNAVDPPNPTEPRSPSDSPLGVYSHAAVTSSCAPCADVGRDILLEGGSAVDAAIASLFCDGVACLQSMGLGGGFFMTIYNHTTGEVHTLNAREVAPLAAYEEMYDGDDELSRRGGLAVAVPGAALGYWEAYQRFGRLSWKRLITPAIQLCEKGIVVTEYLASLLKSYEEYILNSQSMSEILIDPATGEVLVEGDRIYRFGLANTLRVIAAEGGGALYTGSLAAKFVQDLQELGSIITLQDLANYSVRWEPPVRMDLSGHLTAYSVNAPGSGPLLAFILNVLDGFVPSGSSESHRIVETLKWAFGQRTHLGDPYFVDVEELVNNLTSKTFAMNVRQGIDDTRTWNDPGHYGADMVQSENHGTAHISVLAADGSAVSVTSTINYIFGAMVRARNMDIILNDEMDDFSKPSVTRRHGLSPSPANFIRPGKRPLSSMCPTIVVDQNGDVRLVVGAAGGTKITSTVALVTMKNLWFGADIKQAVDSPRLHHQLFPMEAQYEYGTLQEVVDDLELVGHVTNRFGTRSSCVTAIANIRGNITANADFRRDTQSSGY